MIFISVLTMLGVTCLYMWGGQHMKIIRRFGVPAFATLMSSMKQTKSDKRWIKYLILALLLPILSLGYGDNSVFKIYLKYDWAVRIAVGLIMGSPFTLIGLWWAPVIMAGAFSVRAGGGHLWGKDFLWEDLARALTLSACIVIMLWRVTA